MKHFRQTLILLILLFACGISAGCSKKKAPVVDAQVEPVKVAVESSFLPTAKLLAYEFMTNTGIGVVFTDGSNADLTNMILRGGDYDVLMASDLKHPEILIEKGKAQSGGAQVYAFGIPALYSKVWKVNWTGVKYLKCGQFTSLGIANPEDNPYGRAAIETLKTLDLYDALQDKLVYTADHEDALTRIKAKEIDAGFIAYSSLSDRSKRWAWIVPSEIYEPIGQGAVLLRSGTNNKSAETWMGYLSSNSAQSIIQQSGYGVLTETNVSSSD